MNSGTFAVRKASVCRDRCAGAPCYVMLCYVIVIVRPLLQSYIQRRKLATSIVRATDFGPAVMLPCYAPINHTRPLPRNPNYLFTHLPTPDGWMAELAVLADR